jgi:anti-anti-sigma factor
MITHPEDGFQLTTTLNDAGEAHIRIAGDLDWDTADQLTRAATACLGTAPVPPGLLLDCARLTLCDSLGLSSLLMIHRQAGEVGVRLYLVNRPAALQRLLQITGTDHIFMDAAEDASATDAEAADDDATG